MKLRLRSLETKQTHKIEVSNTCNLQQLKEIIIFQLFPSSSSSSSSSSSCTDSHRRLLLSLNKTVGSGEFHELSVPSAEIGDLLNAHVDDVSVIENPRNCVEELGKTYMVESGETMDTHEGNSSKIE
ncbi:unnamed protein product [Amaranthus hypochondriacus]